MNLEQLKEAKKSKQSDIYELNKLIEIEENKEYDFIIGKYFKLAATCIFRVDKIDYVDESIINCTGLHIHGGVAYSDEFRIDISGDNSLYKNDSNHEITKEQFIETMNKWNEEAKQRVMELLN